MPSRPYVVRQGDYLDALAHRFGFDAREVWESADNRALREQRGAGNVLAPGDVLQIPATPAPAPRFQSGGTQRYRAHVPTVHIAFVLRGTSGGVSGEPYEIRGVGQEPIRGSTNGEGVVELDVPITTTSFELELTRHGVVHPVLVGHLDPIDLPSGLEARLVHLGYLMPMPSRAYGHFSADQLVSETERARQVESAVRNFQSDHHIDPTGELCERTRTALLRAHTS
ncbi:MAG: hypothetical protein U0271_05360 [Polyangiaceae bacterium]